MATNHIFTSTNGINVKAACEDCVITSNIARENSGSGILIETGATDTIVSCNNMKGNTGTNYSDSGTGTVSANNIS